MHYIQIYKNLAWLNELTAGEAESVFTDCCGSPAWARRMATARPYPMLEDLYAAAGRIWNSLTPADRLDAYSMNTNMESPEPAYLPQIRTLFSAVNKDPGLNATDRDVGTEFAEAARLYEDKFGFIFVLCTHGKTFPEMLVICRARLGNSVETEMRIASDEQRKIIEIKLDQLLEQ